MNSAKMNMNNRPLSRAEIDVTIALLERMKLNQHPVGKSVQHFARHQTMLLENPVKTQDKTERVLKSGEFWYTKTQGRSAGITFLYTKDKSGKWTKVIEGDRAVRK